MAERAIVTIAGDALVFRFNDFRWFHGLGPRAVAWPR